MLSVYHLTVHHSARDHGEHVSVAARDRRHAQILACEVVRTRHGYPLSIALFASVDSQGKVAV